MYLAAQFFMIFGALIVLAIVFAGILALGVILLTIGLISRHLNRKKGINKRYPKVCIIIGGIFMAISLGIFGMYAISFLNEGGSKYNPDTYDPHTSTGIEDSEYNKKIIMEVVRCLDEGDVEGLKGLFCEDAKKYEELDLQIDEAMDIYDGKCVAYYDFASEAISDARSNGYYSCKIDSVEIRRICTDEGKEYFLQVTNVLVNDSKPEREGVTKIVIRNPDNLSEILIQIGE